MRNSCARSCIILLWLLRAKAVQNDYTWLTLLFCTHFLKTTNFFLSSYTCSCLIPWATNKQTKNWLVSACLHGYILHRYFHTIKARCESPSAHNSFCQRDKIQVAGSRKIWGTLKSTTTSAVSNAGCSLTGMNADHLIFKRKYKTPTQPKIQADGDLSFEVMRPYLKIWRKNADCSTN